VTVNCVGPSTTMLGKILRDARPTTDARSERCLAAALGYPKSWRVVRKVAQFKDEKATGDSDNNKAVVEDRIYAGNPNLSVDTYFNHEAARKAALKWVEGESSGYDQKGGQLLPMVSLYNKKDAVEVYYESDDNWYEATIVKRIEYDDDIRYTVHYTEEDSTQKNISQDLIRPASQKRKKRKLEKQQQDGDEEPASQAEQDEMNDADLATAQSMGLPEGWTARHETGRKWDIRGPDGKQYRSKKAALDYVKYQLQKEELEGDPPWRKTDHKYLGVRVKWTHKVKYSGRRHVDVSQSGTVVGWISDTDVDKNGDPGFVSEKTGEKAELFNVKFDDDPNHPYANHLLDEQDLEEYEILDCLLP